LIAGWRIGGLLQIAVGDQGAVRFDAQEKTLAGRNQEHAAIWEPVDAARKGRRLEDDLAVALEIDGDDLRRAPVGEPEPAFMPTRLLAELDVSHKHLHLGHGHTSSRRKSNAIAPIPVNPQTQNYHSDSIALGRSRR